MSNILDLIFNVKTKNNSLPKIEKGLEDVSKKTEKTTKKMSSDFSKAFKSIAAGFSAKMMVDSIAANEKLALGLDIIEAKNKKLAQAMNNTEKASLGLANKFDMVESVNKAMAFGISLSNGRYEKLLRMATKVSAVMGTSVKDAFNDIIVASGRQSKMIADNLGVIVSATDANNKYAAQLGKTAAQLTDNEKKTAFLNEMILQMGESTSKVSDKMVKDHTKTANAMKRVTTALSLGMQEVVKWANKALDLLDDIARYAAMFKTGSIILSRKDEKELELMASAYDSRVKMEDSLRALQTGWTIQSMSNFRALKRNVKDVITEMKNYTPTMTFTDKDSDKVNKDAERDAKKRIAANKRYASERLKIQKTLSITLLNNNKKYLNAEGVLFDRSNSLNKVKSKYKDLTNAQLKAENEKLSIQKKIDARVAQERKTAWQIRKDTLAQEQASIEQKIKDHEERKLAIERKKFEESQATKKKYFGVAENLGRGLFSAIISDQENAVEKYLANQALMYGQDLLWDGARTILMGEAKNAIIPGTGLSATAIGAIEIAAGASLMAGGLVAQSSMSSSSNSSGATERAVQQKEQQTINFNVNASLYGSKKEAKKEIKGLL